MIKLDKLETAPIADLNERFEEFRARQGTKVRELSEYAAVEQDVLILAWAWGIGGWAGDEVSWIEHLVDVVSSEYDVHRVRDYKRKKLDREVLLDRLIDHAAREGAGSIEYLITHAPEEYQQILTWRYVAGYSAAEIGAMLGKTEQTITGYFRKAYREIKDRYVTPLE